ncbi:invasion associated locus B family protein [Lentilitoribacter sp. Alg239-R112]|uniref:invasion associated locus B family protein n=1 Tax=Lentilitoribacter sp. Alg239-R112 TaxID=2305987 RepID=UPI0013A6F708|nr:invasion associated locus B family protein [Lentilitoribacter sp. Alg239-R112]
MTCSNQAAADKLSCSMSQSIFRDKPRQRILGINIFRDKLGSVTMRIQLPHGLNLVKGIDLSIDDSKVVNHPIGTTDANGAYATVAILPNMIVGMKAGNKLTVAVHDLVQNKIKIEVNLKGFSKSFDLMK